MLEPSPPLRRGRAGIGTSRPRWRRSRASLPTLEAQPATVARRRCLRDRSRPRGSALCRLRPRQAGRGLEPRDDPRLPRAHDAYPLIDYLPPPRHVPRGYETCATAGASRPRGTSTSLARDDDIDYTILGAAHPRGARLRVLPGTWATEWLDHLPFTQCLHRRARRLPQPAARSSAARDGDPPEPIPGVDRRTDPRGRLGLRLARPAAAGGPARVPGREPLAHREWDLRRACGWPG